MKRSYVRNLLVCLVLLLLLLLGSQLKAADYYWVGGAGGWSDLNHWSSTSGGPGNKSIVPSAGDDVYFDANSGLLANSVVDLPTTGPAYCRNMSWVGVTAAANLIYRGQPLYINGNMELAASVRYGTQGISFVGSGNATFKMNGAGRYPVAGWYNPFSINKPGGSLTLLDDVPGALVVTSITLLAGHLDMAGGTHSFGTLSAGGSTPRSLDISNATLAMSNTWDYRGTNNTINTTGSSISAVLFHSDRFSFPKVDITAVSSSSMVINNTTFGELTFTSTAGAANALRIGANNTVDRLEFKSGGAIAGGGNVIRDLFIAPSNTGFAFVGNNTITGTMHANTPDCNALSRISGSGANATITFGPGAVVDIQNVYLSNLAAAGSISLPITVTGADGGGNAGWAFQPRATGTTLYWVGGAGDWSDKAHWSATSGGTGGYCVPFTGDDVIFDANSGFSAGNNTITSVNDLIWCHNMTWTNVSAAPVLNLVGATLQQYGSISLGSTVTVNGNITFKGTEASTFTANGFTLGSPIFRVEKTAPNGGITFMDDIAHTGFRIFHNSGKLIMANRTLHLSQISVETSGTRTLDISNSTITLEHEWLTNSSNNTWVNNGAGSFIIAKSRFITNGLTYPKVQCGATGSDVAISNASIDELLFTNTAPTSATIVLGGNNTIGTLEMKGGGELRGNNTITNLLLAPSAIYTIRNTQTINGLFRFNSPACSGLGELRGVIGVSPVLNFGASSTRNFNNVYLANMTATGSGVPVTVTGADAGGNTGFNITSSDSGPRYWVGGSGDWNDGSHWSATSGGPGGACVPTVANDVYFDANSFTSGSSAVSITAGHAYCRNMDWTGAAFAPVFSKSASFSLEIWGNLVMNPAVTMNAVVTITGGTNNSITSNGSTLGNFDMFIQKPTGNTLVFTDNYSNTQTRLDLRNGGLDVSGRTMVLEALSDAGVATPHSLNITNANITGAYEYAGASKTLQATGSIINAPYFVANGGAYNQVNVSTANSAWIAINNTSITDLVFSHTAASSGAWLGVNNTIGKLEFKGRGYIGNTGNVISTLIFSPGKIYTFLAGSNTTITGDWFGSGTPCNLTEIVSTSATVNATVTKTSGSVEFDYIRVKGITAAGNTPFIAHEHSVDQGNNVNWTIDPYNGSGTIIGLGSDKILQSSEFPYTINTNGFFASPLAQFLWNDGSTQPTLVVTGPGTYSVRVSYPDGCSRTDEIVISRASADLAIVKTAGSMTPAVGSDVVFTLVATNNGPQQSTGISVTDLLGAGYTYKSSTPPAGTTYDAGTGVWTIGTLASAASSTLTITATVNAAGPYVNTATITGPEVDAVAANNSSAITPVPVPTADVSVVKTVDNGSPQVGSNVVFTLTMNNAGPSNATNVVVTDLLPDGYTYVSSVMPVGTTYNPVNGLWTIGTLASGANATATITATVKPTGTYANTASVTLTENDPQTANNTSIVTPVPIPLANLSIVKTVNNSQPYAGNNVIFTLTAANAGPSSATGVQVNDLLPSGYTFVSATPSVGTYNPSTGVWTIGTLASAANATLTITATVKDAGAYANTATITGTETDPVTANNSSTVTPTPIIIKVTKTGPSTVNAGALVQYILSVKNTGTGNALAAVIADVVPAELTNVSWTTALQGTATVTAGATGTGNNVNVTGNIPAGAANQIDISVSGTIPPASLASSISNTATVTAPGSPVISSNTVITAIGREVDLHVQKTGPATVVAGSTVVYTLNVTNTGPSDASNVAITDNIPAGLNNVTWTATAQNGAVINGASTGTGNVNLLGFIPAGTASMSVNITGTLDASYAGAILVNTATATPAAGVTDLTPASSTITSTVSRRANVRIVKSGPANIGAGENISYTIRVTNDGPSNAPGVEIKDVIPAQVLNPTWTATVQNGATLSALAGTGNINLTGSIPAGAGLVEILVSGQANPGLANASTFSNTATADLPVGSPVTDPELISNSSTIQTTVNNTPDIRVSKNGPSTVNVGDPITYTIVITNGGGGNVTGALIADNVPASVTVSNWSIVAAGGAAVTGAASGTTNTISSIGDIPASASASLTLTVQGTVNVNAAPTFTNTVTVTAGGVATSSVATAVNQSTDIVVEKNGPQAVIAGRPISYTVRLSNAGPQNAQGLILNDVIPAAVQNVTWSAAAVGSAVINSPSNGNNNTVMVNADVNAGAGNYVLITVNGTVASSTVLSTITNTASVTLPGSLTDFDLTNNTSVVNTVVSRETNLAITKAVDNVAPDAGSNVVFTLVANNNGPSEATGVKVADPLPAGYTYVSSAAPAGTTYSPGTGEWTIGTLANAASSTLTITAKVNAVGSYANTATISGTEPDPIIANNTATVTPVPLPVTDLAITKTADNLTPAAGSNIVFTLVASNNGPSAGTGVSVTDLLPAGYTYVSSVAPAGTSYNPGSGVWMIGTLANAASSTLTITAKVNATGPYANTATISGTENDPAAANNTATVTPLAAPTTDLAITKTANNPTPNAGTNIVFTVVATNNGPSGATGVSVMDLLPAGYTYVSSTAPGTSYAPVTGVWTIGTLANAASATLTITARVNATGPYVNTATITGIETDLVPANNTTTVTPVPVPVSDLAITKAVDNMAPNAGSNVVFTLVASNNGPNGATGVSVTDLLPAGYTYVSSVAPAGTTYDPLTGIWTIGTLANTTSSILTITATVNAAGPYANAASISGTETDLVAGNNAATVTPVPVPVTDLMVVKTADLANPTMGSNIVFTIVATNNGPSGATGVSVTDLLPAGYTYVSSAPAAGTTYVPATGLWTIGALSNGASATLTVTATVNASGAYANSATISGTETDLVTANNASSVTPVPVPVTDLMVVKTADLVSVAVGSNIVFTVVASNNGPSEGTGVTVTDLLPAGYTYVSSAPEPGTNYDAVTGVWTIGTLANGASSTLTVTATLNASGDYMNTATISGAENDPIAANNTATVTPVAEPVTDLLVTMTASDLAPNTGSNMIFNIVVTNNGPSDGTGISVTDLLPAGYTYVSSTVPAGTAYNPVTGVWTIGSLANTGSMTLSITARVNATGPYANTATTSGTENDPVPANNTVTVTPVPQPVTDLALVKTVDQAAPAVGSNVIFTLVAANNGPNSATGVAVTDLLPAGYTYISVTAPAGTTYVPATGLWTIGALANGANSTLTITARVNQTGPYLNSASITGVEQDLIPANNTATVTSVPLPMTDLAIVKTADNANPFAGGNIVFTLVATNNGPDAATGVNVTDLLPAGYTYISATAPAGTTYTPATGLWTIGTLANAASSTLTITARVNATGSYANMATISGAETDLIPANNTATVTPTPGTQANLITVKTLKDPAQTSFVPGQAVVYSIKVTNNGPSSASAVHIQDVAPAGTTISSWTTVPAAGVVYPNASGTGNLNETISVLDNGLTATYEVTVLTPANLTGTLTNTVQVSSATSDPDPGCTTCTTPPIPAVPGEFVTWKTVATASGATKATAGEELTYTIYVRNTGQVLLTALNITDPVPAHTSYVSGGTLSGGAVNFNMSNLALGATATVSFKVKVDADLTGVSAITNTASVSDGTTTKPTGGCDPAVAGCSIQPGTVIPVANNPLLAISKSASEAVYQNDGSYLVTYTMKLANMGDVPLTNVQVPDDLKAVFPAPAQFSVDGSVQASGQLIAGSGYDGTGSVNLLAPGSLLGVNQEATITFSVRIRPSRFFGPFTNQVTATANANGRLMTASSSNGSSPDMNSDGVPDAASATPLTLKLVPLTISNVFTPNGDNRNETFVIKGLDLYPDNELTIVNRWGNTVFERKNYRNDWAATGLNEGTYFYLLKVKRESGDWEIYKGYVTLLRNK